MPLDAEHLTLEEAFADLEDEKEGLADEIAQIPPDNRADENDEYLDLLRRSNTVLKHIGALEYVREEYGDDVEFEFRGLSTGEFLTVRDRKNDLRAESITPTKSVEEVSRIFFVAAGLEHGPGVDAGDDFEATCAIVRDEWPPQLTEWAEEQISALTTVGEAEGNGSEQLAADFRALVEEKTETYHPKRT